MTVRKKPSTSSAKQAAPQLSAENAQDRAEYAERVQSLATLADGIERILVLRAALRLLTAQAQLSSRTVGDLIDGALDPLEQAFTEMRSIMGVAMEDVAHAHTAAMQRRNAPRAGEAAR